jgi:addiction module RelE/StbE family toxin
MSYKIIITDDFYKKAKKIFKKHKDIINRYQKTLELLENNPYHPSLRLHKLQGKLFEYYSVSITMEYRIIIDFIIEDGQIILVDIGSHDEVY